MMKNYRFRFHRHQRGFTLLEALIAFAVLAIGLLAAFRFHSTTMSTTAGSKIRGEAVALAEQKLEQLRSYYGAEELDGNGDGVIDNDFDTDMPSSTDAEFLNELNTDENLPAVFVDDGYAATFTRNWSVRGTNPRQVDVRVTWVDRTGVDQRVQLSTLIWETLPAEGAAQFAQALTSSGDASVWPPAGGGGGGGGGSGEGVGKILIGDTYDGYGIFDEVSVVNVDFFYDIFFTGSIVATDDGLDGVALAGAPNSGPATCTVSGDLNAATPVAVEGEIDANGDPVYQWFDADGALIDPPPYTYECIIKGIPDGLTWSGTATFDPAGNDAVCIPDSGALALSFSQQSPADLQLGIVVLTNNGACNSL